MESTFSLTHASACAAKGKLLTTPVAETAMLIFDAADDTHALQVAPLAGPVSKWLALGGA